jgi:hypothetical protein
MRLTNVPLDADRIVFGFLGSRDGLMLSSVSKVFADTFREESIREIFTNAIIERDFHKFIGLWKQVTLTQKERDSVAHSFTCEGSDLDNLSSNEAIMLSLALERKWVVPSPELDTFITTRISHLTRNGYDVYWGPFGEDDFNLYYCPECFYESKVYAYLEVYRQAFTFADFGKKFEALRTTPGFSLNSDANSIQKASESIARAHVPNWLWRALKHMTPKPPKSYFTLPQHVTKKAIKSFANWR